MHKQALVIGLGQFGMSLARFLAERGVEVQAVDLSEDLVRRAAEFADEALAFDATDEAALARVAPARRDLCVCAIGPESREASIICTALLRQQGAPQIVARATDTLHERILRLVGAHEVVNPERDFGERLANRFLYEEIMGEMPLGEELVITEFRPPASFFSRTLMELSLPRRFGVTVVAIRERPTGRVYLPEPGHPVGEDDILVVVSRKGSVGKLLEKS
jgi:trk system potassium uptake protein